MAGNLKAIKDLIAHIESLGRQAMSKQDILDILVSHAKVAGTLSLRTDQTQTTLAGWNRLDVFDTARSTQGVFEGLGDVTDPGAWWQIRNAAAGDYTCSMSLRFTADTDGTYDFRITHATDDLVPTVYESEFSPFQDSVTLVAGEVVHVAISSAIIKDLGAKERIQVEYRGPNGSVMTAHKGQFGIQR